MPQNPLKNLTLKVEGKKARKEQKKRRELPGSAASVSYTHLTLPTN